MLFVSVSLPDKFLCPVRDLQVIRSCDGYALCVYDLHEISHIGIDIALSRLRIDEIHMPAAILNIENVSHMSATVSDTDDRTGSVAVLFHLC